MRDYDLLPFTEKQIGKNIFIRTFSSSICSDEMQWHWDEEDRYFELVEPSNWLFQFDDKLPQTFDGRLFIPKHTWHRGIKKDGDLIVRIEKIV